MKKFIISLTALMLMLFMLSSCGKSEAVKAAEGLINDIGAITADSKNAIETAEKNYAVLTDEEKEDVKNYDILEKARADYDMLTAVTGEMAAVKEKTEKVFTSDGISYAEITDEYNAVTEKYNALSEELKAQAGDFSAVKAAYDAYIASFDEFIKPGATYIKAFRKINEDKNYEITDIGCLVQERDGRRAAFYALSYKDEEGNEKKVYSTAKLPADVPLDTVVYYKDSCFVEKLDSDRFNAFTNGNVALDINTVSEQANQ